MESWVWYNQAVSSRPSRTPVRKTTWFLSSRFPHSRMAPEVRIKPPAWGPTFQPLAAMRDHPGVYYTCLYAWGNPERATSLLRKEWLDGLEEGGGRTIMTEIWAKGEEVRCNVWSHPCLGSSLGSDTCSNPFSCTSPGKGLQFCGSQAPHLQNGINVSI